VVNLKRRLNVLEQLAEEARLAPYRRLAARYGVPLDELLAETERIMRRGARLRARGMSIDEAFAELVAEAGLDADTLKARVEEDAWMWEGS
jgi:hypothetical protein